MNNKPNDSKKQTLTKLNPPPFKPWNDPKNIQTANIAVFINKSTYNIEIHSKHQSGTKIRNLICNNYTKFVQEHVKDPNDKDKQLPDPITELWVHRFHYAQPILLQLKPHQIIDAWNNNIAWEIVCVKPHMSWDEKPQFQVLQVQRPSRPKRPGEPGYKPGW